MSKGPKCSTQRAKSSKHLRGNSKKKRLKNEDSEKQAAYKAKRAARAMRKAKK